MLSTNADDAFIAKLQDGVSQRTDDELSAEYRDVAEIMETIRSELAAKYGEPVYYYAGWYRRASEISRLARESRICGYCGAAVKRKRRRG